ncbi:MAG TPA: gas vesicle protein GvpG [Ktedonobacterales bacterium]|nr:gas vesicle protein GvpG [Ktedonobacterales bacterium]
MGLLSDLLLLPVTGPARGLLFIAERIKEQVDEERLGEISAIEDSLMSLSVRYELGELSDQAYADEEDALLERLNEVRNEQEDWLDTEEIEGEVDEAPIESESEYTDEP